MRQTNDSTPYFANRANVSGDAGIAGNNQEPVNWGPPGLIFSSGIAGLTTASTVGRRHGRTGIGRSVWRTRGGHNVTFGGASARNLDVFSQQNARGTSPSPDRSPDRTSPISCSAFRTLRDRVRQRRQILRARSVNAYVTDDWRISPALTVNTGVRWEYESPFTESLGRLVNLDVAPGFSAATPVVGADARTRTAAAFSRASASRCGQSPDRRWSFAPATAFIATPSVYQSMALMLAQQPPLSQSVERREQRGASVDAGQWIQRPGAALSNTFAVDPDFRVGYAHNWQVSVQRDLPASLTVTATYLGTKGSRLMQEFVPNTYPAGAVESVPGVPERLRLPDVERQFAEECRPAPGAPPAAQRADRRRAVHVVEGDRQCRGIHGSRPQRRRDRAGLARPRRRAGAVELRSASSADGAGRVRGSRRCCVNWTFTSQLTAAAACR